VGVAQNFNKELMRYHNITGIGKTTNWEIGNKRNGHGWKREMVHMEMGTPFVSN